MPLILAFFLALFIGCFSQALFPELPLMPFSPFLAIASLRLSLQKTLWLALACGLCLDLLSSEPRLGVYAIPYLASVLILYRLRKHFFEDKLVAFSLYSAAISSLTTLGAALFSKIHWTLDFIAVDVVLLPCIDGLFGYLLFALPYAVFIYTRKLVRIRLLTLGWKKT